MRKRQVLFATLLAVVPLSLLAGPVDEKGFVFVGGETPLLRAEPDANARDTAQAMQGSRVPFRKVIREGGAVSWYFVDQPGVGTGWLHVSNTTDRRPTPVVARPIPRASPVPLPAGQTGKAPPPLVTRSRIAQVAGAQTAGSRAIGAKALEARGLASAADADRIVEQATIDYVTLERVIGIQMSDPPHPDGRYADLTARGRKADADAFARAVAEGD